jgi:CxxC-x17-CxxC domain-containing protein
MTLADYDEALVGGKIWTEPQHIEEQLARLTEHMEFVIQKFLRDKYPTIEDYNIEAGEVAEPYRVLVVVNFPVNFSESAARRLVSIALNGPRCGVYTIITVDTEQQLPYGFHKRDDMDNRAAAPSEAIRRGNHIGYRNYALEAYCFKCRTKREMKDPKSITMVNGKPAIQGTCRVCGTKMFRIKHVGKRETPTNRHKMYPAICATCGKECEVPFQPREGRPVYCSECYAEIKEGDNKYDEDKDGEDDENDDDYYDDED